MYWRLRIWCVLKLKDGISNGISLEDKNPKYVKDFLQKIEIILKKCPK